MLGYIFILLLVKFKFEGVAAQVFDVIQPHDRVHCSSVPSHKFVLMQIKILTDL